jgi:plastocyanin
MSPLHVSRGATVARARASRRSPLLAAAVLPLLAASLLSCISERSTGTEQDPQACDVPLPSSAFGSTVVIIRNFAFTPALVNVRPGTKVTWVNCGLTGAAPHTSTADGGAWSSPLLAPGETYTREFTTAGTFPYHCNPHPSMKATVTVQ